MLDCRRLTRPVVTRPRKKPAGDLATPPSAVMGLIRRAVFVQTTAAKGNCFVIGIKQATTGVKVAITGAFAKPGKLRGGVIRVYRSGSMCTQ